VVQRPQSVEWFEKLQYIQVTMGALVLILSINVFHGGTHHWDFTVSQNQKTINWQRSGHLPLLDALAIEGFLFALFVGVRLFFVWRVTRWRRDWARWVMILWLVIGLSMSPEIVSNDFRDGGALLAALAIISALAALPSLICLFMTSTRRWVFSIVDS